MLLVGSCFVQNIGAKLERYRLPVCVNPSGTLYNPASIAQTLQETSDEQLTSTRHLVLTFGTPRCYILKETGQVVKNCEKRPANLFLEYELSIQEMKEILHPQITRFLQLSPEGQIILTVSPFRYRKYGYHGSQLGKAKLLLLTEELRNVAPERICYFPAYELIMDELRDYRFYQPDMLHPSAQAVDYIWERLRDNWFSPELKEYLTALEPHLRFLEHRPNNPNDTDYLLRKNQAEEAIQSLTNQL